MKKDLDKATQAVEKAKSKESREHAEMIRSNIALEIQATEEQFERESEEMYNPKRPQIKINENVNTENKPPVSYTHLTLPTILRV